MSIGLSKEDHPNRSGSRRGPDLLATIEQAGNFETLVAAVERAGLATVFAAPGPYTLFAPDDRAFGRLPAGAVNSLFGEPHRLASVLAYHLAPGHLGADELASLPRVATLHGEELLVSSGPDIRVDGAALQSFGIEASNGAIHVVERVLLPARF